MSERKPLTLEELRKMDGKPLFVECLNPQKYICPPVGYRILSKSITGRFGVWDGENCLIERDYGTDWIAYSYEPPRLGRSAWEPCEQCRNGNTIIDIPACDQFGLMHNGKSNEQLHFLFQFPFCPHCGRPLTDAAWKILEERLEGAK